MTTNAILLFLLATLTIQAEDWTVAGKTYHNVSVQGSDDATVSIMYDGGIGRVNLSDLPPDLQKRFGYDPIAAKKASIAEQAREAASDAMVVQAKAQEKAEQLKEKKAEEAAAPQTFEEKVRSARAAARSRLQSQIDADEKELGAEQVQYAAYSGTNPDMQKSRAAVIDSIARQIDQLKSQLAQLQ